MVRSLKAVFNVGFNFDPALAERLVYHNNKARTGSDGYLDGYTIGTVYGSIPFNPIGTARPTARIPAVSVEQADEAIGILRKDGIGWNMTINTFCLGDLKAFMENRPALIKWLKDFVEPRCKAVTVAHPLVLDAVVESGIKVDIEISTILNVDHIAQFYYYMQFPQVRKICVSIEMNRDFHWLSNVRRAGESRHHNPLHAELLVNEFCTVGGAPCHGILRDSCYQCHSHNVFNPDMGFPMEICTASRWLNPASWLKAKFILPQWVQTYIAKTGVRHFKISGRTHPSSYIDWVVEKYMRGQYTGNLLALWAQLETIYKGVPPMRAITDFDKIFNIGMNEEIFYKMLDWFADGDCWCRYECGQGCLMCDGLYQKLADRAAMSDIEDKKE